MFRDTIVVIALIILVIVAVRVGASFIERNETDALVNRTTLESDGVISSGLQPPLEFSGRYDIDFAVREWNNAYTLSWKHRGGGERQHKAYELIFDPSCELTPGDSQRLLLSPDTTSFTFYQLQADQWHCAQLAAYNAPTNKSLYLSDRIFAAGSFFVIEAIAHRYNPERRNVPYVGVIPASQVLWVSIRYPSRLNLEDFLLDFQPSKLGDKVAPDYKGTTRIDGFSESRVNIGWIMRQGQKKDIFDDDIGRYSIRIYAANPPDECGTRCSAETEVGVPPQARPAPPNLLPVNN